jgi:hypothetical protein
VKDMNYAYAAKCIVLDLLKYNDNILDENINTIKKNMSHHQNVGHNFVIALNLLKIW